MFRHVSCLHQNYEIKVAHSIYIENEQKIMLIKEHSTMEGLK